MKVTTMTRITGNIPQYNFQVTSSNNIQCNTSLSMQKPYVAKTSDQQTTTFSGKLPFENKPDKKGFKKVAGKIAAPFKKLTPGRIVTIGMIGVMFFVKCAPFVGGSKSNNTHTSNQPQSADAVEWSYKQGEKHALDSLKTANLQKELQMAKDSIKTLKKMAK